MLEGFSRLNVPHGNTSLIAPDPPRLVFNVLTPLSPTVTQIHLT